MRKQKIIIPFLSVILGLIVGAIVMLLTGHNPIQAYDKLIQGAGLYGDVGRFGNTLLETTTLILTGLSVAFAFRTGLFNIGAAGQMLMGGFAAVYVGVAFTLPKYIHLPIAVLIAVIVGAMWAFLPGLLKAKYRIHEVVSTIMMNYIALWTVYYFVPVLIPGGFNTESKTIQTSASLRFDWISNLFAGSYVNIGLILALLAALLIWWILEKTTFGYELKAVGFNLNASKYAGMKVNRNMILSMMISGALAGLAGATFYLGYGDNIKIGVVPTHGFDGIAVALLGLNNPFGVVISALLFGVMGAGRLFMQSATDVPNELVPIIIAIIVFFAATSLMIENMIKKVGKLFSKKEGDK